MNPDLQALQAYPFENLRQLFSDITPNPDRSEIRLSMGEPRHTPPAFVLEELAANLDKLSNYPLTMSIIDLRQAIASWLEHRFDLAHIDTETQVLSVNGTREALFSFAQAVVTRGPDVTVLSPNPFYQIYEGAALLAGARPKFINTSPTNPLLPDFDSISADEWQQCQLLYLCSPGNPTGAVIPVEKLQQLVNLAREHDFVIASDECYSEIYFDESHPPPGLLQACELIKPGDYRNCVVFHSLSKRSNLPGLRSGFVAGDAELLKGYLKYRTYHGCAMPLHHQYASVAAWTDETHVIENRRLYREKFSAVLDILEGHWPAQKPEAGFYLWPETPIPDTDFACHLYAQENVITLPGRFLARRANGINPGENRVRIALVAELEQCTEAAHRIVHAIETL